MSRISTSSRQPRRHSSSSNSLSPGSVTTAKSSEIIKAIVASETTSKPMVVSNILTETTDTKSHSKRPSSHSSRRHSSSVSNKSAFIANEEIVVLNRWSRSSNSSTATPGRERHSSFSKRFSLGTSSRTAGYGASYRSPSPHKKQQTANEPRPVSPQRTASRGKPSTSTLQSSDRSTSMQLPALSSQHNHQNTLSREKPEVAALSMISNSSQPSSKAPNGIDHTKAESQLMTMPIDRLDKVELHNHKDGGQGEDQILDHASDKTRKPHRLPLDDFDDVQHHRRKTLPGKNEHHKDDTSARSSSQLDKEMSQPVRTRSRREKDKKAMLSKALQCANDAVLLDSGQEYTKATEAYEEACNLLGQVMSRSSNEDDKRKLTAIRATYATRVEEIRQLEIKPPMSDIHDMVNGNRHFDDAAVRIGLDGANDKKPLPIIKLAQRSTLNEDEIEMPTHSTPPNGPKHAPPNAGERDVDRKEHVPARAIPAVQMLPLAEQSNMPAPLSPRRFLPLDYQPLSAPSGTSEWLGHSNQQTDANLHGYAKPASNEWYSWLDTVMESGRSSRSSSNHSVSSHIGLHRKNIRTQSGNTTAGFNAALDAAIEAAYDEGFEPYEDIDAHSDQGFSLSNPTNGSMADTHAKREQMAQVTKSGENMHRVHQHSYHRAFDALALDHTNDADEVDRLLEDVIRGQLPEQPTSSAQFQPILPQARESDSSGISSGTWGGSVTSSLTTAGTSLSPVDENIGHISTYVKQPALMMQPPAPPPTGALPKPPSWQVSRETASPLGGSRTGRSMSGPTQAPVLLPRLSVQDRRTSGQKSQKLKIRTAADFGNDSPKDGLDNLSLRLPTQNEPEKSASPPRLGPQDAETQAGVKQDKSKSVPETSIDPDTVRVLSSLQPTFHREIAVSGYSTMLALGASESHESVMRPSLQSVPSMLNMSSKERPQIRTDLSSTSLRRRPSHTPANDSFENSPVTPMSLAFSSLTSGRTRFPSQAPTSPAASALSFSGRPSGRMSLFDDDVHFAITKPGSPGPPIVNPVKPLEPCPESFLLRPFWLMRCVYQTIAHPRGGYLTTKLFIPAEAWMVQNVKLKGLDEKISNCDLLTAALLKLSAVNTLDADAVLEEMQSLETVLDQAQANLSKKLGNEVGLQNISSLFKEAPSNSTSPNTELGQHSDGTAGFKISGKSYLSSWRKIRNKSSNTAFMNTYSTAAPKSGLTMHTVPLTDSVSAPTRFAKRKRVDIKCEGPNANYMSALARLCDAAQVLDPIARQVEDPGLKHSSSTHVGLELSARHAAEFFGFYICRFALQDVTLLAEKYVKRTSEFMLV